MSERLSNSLTYLFSPFFGTSNKLLKNEDTDADINSPPKMGGFFISPDTFLEPIDIFCSLMLIISFVFTGAFPAVCQQVPSKDLRIHYGWRMVVE